MGSLIEATADDRVRYLTINRPDQLNALNADVLALLEQHLVDAAGDQAVGAIVIRGAGDRAFCAGADLKEISGLASHEAQAFIRRGQRTMDAIESSGTPIIAAVDGWALGGGMELMLACHVVVASERSRFGLPEAKIGCIPGFGGTQRLLLSAGKAQALYLMLSGEPVDAATAWSMGLLSLPPVATDAFVAHVADVAARLAAGSRTSTRSILELGRRAARAAALEHEAALAALAISSPDGQEGIAAFAERRPPFFTRESRP
jgi:enoyl-CoA hydratase